MFLLSHTMRWACSPSATSTIINLTITNLGQVRCILLHTANSCIIHLKSQHVFFANELKWYRISNLLKTEIDPDLVGLEWSPRFCISNNFTNNVDDAGPRTTV